MNSQGLGSSDPQKIELQSANPRKFTTIKVPRPSKIELQSASPREFTRIKLATSPREGRPGISGVTPLRACQTAILRQSTVNSVQICWSRNQAPGEGGEGGGKPPQIQGLTHQTQRVGGLSSRAQTLANSQGLGLLDLRKIKLQSTNPSEFTRITLLGPSKIKAPERKPS